MDSFLLTSFCREMVVALALRAEGNKRPYDLLQVRKGCVCISIEGHKVPICPSAGKSEDETGENDVELGR